LPALLAAPAGSIMAVEQAARDFGLVVLTSDHDTSKQGNVLLDAAATTIEEGFDLAATDNPTSTLLQVRAVMNQNATGIDGWLGGDFNRRHT
jgi:hypothetical protein